jgi:hypothetical protein
MTAQQAMAEWETLPQDTREGKRVEPFVKPWKAHVDNAEAAVIDGSHAGIDAKVLNELVSALRWQQEAPDTVEISKLRVMQLDTETGQYGLLTDLKGLNWRNPNVRRMLAICGDFDIKDKAGKRLGVRPFGIVPEDDLAMLPTPNAEFGKDDTRQSERTWRNDYQYTVLVQWGCIEPA